MALTSLKSSSGRKDKSKRVERKLKKKLEFHAKLKDAASSLSAKKTINKKKRLRKRQKKLKAYDLSALSEFLPDIDAPQNDKVPAKLNCKSRQKLVQTESWKWRAVINNPVFQMDPFAAIQHHIESTQPPSPADKQPGKDKKKDKAKKKKKKKAKGLSSGAQSMEI